MDGQGFFLSAAIGTNLSSGRDRAVVPALCPKWL